MKIATIQLDNDEGCGRLYWKDGSIWCKRVEDGEEFDTQTPCREADAERTIARVWGDMFWCLEWN